GLRGPQADRPRPDDDRGRSGRLPRALICIRSRKMSRPNSLLPTSYPGFIQLEDGTRFEGDLVGADQVGLGEVVFNTSMSGYQESVTDPSYAGQIIVFTYPLIGNYGVSAAAMESDRIHARAVVMREAVNREAAPTAESGW